MGLGVVVGVGVGIGATGAVGVAQAAASKAMAMKRIERATMHGSSRHSSIRLRTLNPEPRTQNVTDAALAP